MLRDCCHTFCPVRSWWTDSTWRMENAGLVNPEQLQHISSRRTSAQSSCLHQGEGSEHLISSCIYRMALERAHHKESERFSVLRLYFVHSSSQLVTSMLKTLVKDFSYMQPELTVTGWYVLTTCIPFEHMYMIYCWLNIYVIVCNVTHRRSPHVRAKVNIGSRRAVTRTLNTLWHQKSSCLQVVRAGCRWSQIPRTLTTLPSQTATRPPQTTREDASWEEKSWGNNIK